ncbi:MAG: DUF1566 domain-containing protein [Spirochaetia bacterium]|nr:DUF1566 domain-containing protein [Spirochaetia bacterium]
MHHKYIFLLACSFLVISSGCIQKVEPDDINSVVTGYFLAYAPSSPSSPLAPSVAEFQDKNDGTIYSNSANLFWAKCIQSDAAGGNIYNLSANDCSLTAVSPLLEFCNKNDSDCNGGVGTGVLDGNPGNLSTSGSTGISEVWDTCLNLTLGGRTWRVPSKNELARFYFEIYLTQPSLFPSSPSGKYWSNTSSTDSDAWYLDTSNGAVSLQAKLTTSNVRCVSDGP